MKVNELMFGIQTMDMVLPEFQREYVWTRDQAKKLVMSLVNEYPTGSLLIWKTENPPEIKNHAVARDKIGRTSVILDGQQRMTTLYLLTKNSIPPYYRPEDIANDPLGLGLTRLREPIRVKRSGFVKGVKEDGQEDRQTVFT